MFSFVFVFVGRFSFPTSSFCTFLSRRFIFYRVIVSCNISGRIMARENMPRRKYLNEEMAKKNPPDGKLSRNTWSLTLFLFLGQGWSMFIITTPLPPTIHNTAWKLWSGTCQHPWEELILILTLRVCGQKWSWYILGLKFDCPNFSLIYNLPSVHLPFNFIPIYLTCHWNFNLWHWQVVL